MNIQKQILFKVKMLWRWLNATRRRKILSSILAVLIVLTSIRFVLVKPSEVRADSLVKFDEGYGTTVSDDNGNISGTITGATWQTNDLCFDEKCLFFDGSDWISFGDDADLDFAASTDFTIEFWFRHGPASAAEVIVQKYESTGADGGYRIRMESDGDISFGVDDANGDFADDNITSTAANYDDNRWHHVAAVKDGTTSITLYIDGVQVAQDTSIGSTGTLANDDTFYIGDSNGSDGGDEFIGFLDEVKIYTTSARTQAEVNADVLGATPERGTSAAFGIRDYSFLSEGLVGYWKMDETSGNATDSSGNSTTLTNVSTTAFSAAKFGNGAEPDGTADYFDAADTAALSVTGSLTLSAWIEPDDVSGSQDIIGKFDGSNESYLLALEGDELRMYIDSSSNYETTDAANLAGNTKYHVAGVYNATDQTVNLYVNGELEASTTTGTIPSSIGDDAGEFTIGAEDSSGTAANFFDGHIDDARVYNRAFSPIEAEELYRWGPSPIAYWKFDENTGTGADAVKDTSGNGYHGTTNGSMTNSDWVPGRIGQALQLDGSDDYINIPTEDGNFSSNIFTISAWVRRDVDSGGVERLLDNRDAANDGFSMYVDSNDVLQCSYNGTTVGTGTANLQAGEIAFIACVSDGSTIKLYKNGVPYGSSAISGSISETTDATIGRASYESSEFFAGFMDEIRVYNYVRTDAQLMEDRNAGHPAPGSPIGSAVSAVSYYKFDEGYLDSCEDDAADFCDSLGDNDIAFVGSSSGFTSSGKFGAAFDGTGSIWGQLGDTDDFDFAATDDFSISLWFRSDSATNPSGTEYLLTKFESTGADGGYAFFAQTDGDIVFGIDDDNTSFPEDSVGDIGEDIYDATWHHIVAVKTGTTKLELYVDGVLKDTDSSIAATGTLENNDTIYIADLNGSDDGNELFGDIDETMIFRSALTPSQVRVLYNHASSAVWGYKSTTSAGVADDSRDRSYCPPGDSVSTCAPVAHWPMNENTAQDVGNFSAGAGDDGVLGGSGTVQATDPTWTIGKIGAALEFDGSDDYVQVGNDADLEPAASDDFTITAWVYRDTTGSDHMIISKGSSMDASNRAAYFFWINDTDDIRFQISDGGGTSNDIYTIDSTTTITSPGWNHVAIVWDDSDEANVRIYLNGIDDKQAGSLADISNIGAMDNNSVVHIGRRDGASGLYFDGKLDDVRFYKTARTQAEIAWDMNLGGPIGWWKMDDNVSGDAQTIRDSSGKGNDGTTSNNSTNLDCTIQGKRNLACDLDGTDDFIDMNDVSIFDFDDKSFSISGWFNRDTFTTDDTIVAKKNDQANTSAGFTVWIDDSTDDLRLFVSDGDSTNDHTVDSTSTFTSTGWNHFVIVYDDTSSTGSKIYINGRDDSAGNTTTGTFSSINDLSNAVDFRIGSESDGGVPFDGKLDEVKIFYYRLTDKQVLDDYNSGVLFFGPATGSP